MSNITINELADKVNGYYYGMVTVHTSHGCKGLYSSIIFNETVASEDAITFRQVNQDDVKIMLDDKEIDSIEDKSTHYVITLKSGIVVHISLFHEKDAEAKACHALYGSYNDFLKELDLDELEEKVNKAKKAFVSISDNSSYMKHSYENVRLEDMDISDGTSKLVFFNGNEEEPEERLSFTLYDDAVNDIWLMNGTDGWEGLKIRLFNQPFTEVRISLLYVAD